MDTGRKLDVHKMFRTCPGRLLNVLCTFNLCPVSRGLTYDVQINHGTIIRTGITCKKIPLQNSIEFGMALK